MLEDEIYIGPKIKDIVISLNRVQMSFALSKTLSPSIYFKMNKKEVVDMHITS